MEDVCRETGLDSLQGRIIRHGAPRPIHIRLSGIPGEARSALRRGCSLGVVPCQEGPALRSMCFSFLTPFYLPNLFCNSITLASGLQQLGMPGFPPGLGVCLT